MIVSKLIKKLQLMPQDADVMTYLCNEEGFGDAGSVKHFTDPNNLPYSKGWHPSEEEDALTTYSNIVLISG